MAVDAPFIPDSDIMVASAQRDTQRVRQLLDQGAQVLPDRYGLTPLRAAAGFFDRTCYERSNLPPPSEFSGQSAD